MWNTGKIGFLISVFYEFLFSATNNPGRHPCGSNSTLVYIDAVHSKFSISIRSASIDYQPLHFSYFSPISSICNFGCISEWLAKFECHMILTRNIVASMFISKQLQRIMLIIPTTNIVAERENPTTIANQFENTLIQSIYENTSMRMNWDNAKESKVYERHRNILEKIENIDSKEKMIDDNFVRLMNSFK